MVLGAPAMLGDVYLLILGGLMSAVSIVTKTLVELDTDARFGYDENVSIRQHTSCILDTDARYDENSIYMTYADVC